VLTSTLAAAADPAYHQVRTIPLPGDEGWDYLAYEPHSQRLFIAHGTRVLVLDTRSFAVAGEIPGTPGAHGIALAPELGRGFISAGRSNLIVEFDLHTLARLGQIPTTGEGPDAILYDPATRRVFSFNGRGRNVTAVDATTGKVAGSIALEARPEFAVSDERGHLYVNLADKNSIAELDAHKLAVSAVWPLAGCDGPSGLSIDRSGHRLFPVCENKIMAVTDANTGRSLGSAPIGAGADASTYDGARHQAFASCGEGVLSIVSLSSAGGPTGSATVATEPGARTMALDVAQRRIFLVTADFGTPAAPTAEQPRPRPPQLPNSFRLLVLATAPTS
jgi:DNA-binding beta-propeller fold protein YncE